MVFACFSCGLTAVLLALDALGFAQFVAFRFELVFIDSAGIFGFDEADDQWDRQAGDLAAGALS